MTIVLETQRLTVRRLVADDVDALHAILGDPVTMRHYPSPKSRAESAAWIERCIESYAAHDGLALWAVELRESGQLIGVTGIVLQVVDGVVEHEIGYLYRRDCWGRGYATEAAAACRDFGFATRALPRLISLISPSNDPSRRVAERLGMTLERRTTVWDRPHFVYAIEREAGP